MKSTCSRQICIIRIQFSHDHTLRFHSTLCKLSPHYIHIYSILCDGITVAWPIGVILKSPHVNTRICDRQFAIPLKGGSLGRQRAAVLAKRRFISSSPARPRTALNRSAPYGRKMMEEHCLRRKTFIGQMVCPRRLPLSPGTIYTRRFRWPFVLFFPRLLRDSLLPADISRSLINVATAENSFPSRKLTRTGHLHGLQAENRVSSFSWWVPPIGSPGDETVWYSLGEARGTSVRAGSLSHPGSSRGELVTSSYKKREMIEASLVRRGPAALNRITGGTAGEGFCAAQIIA
jgi:hypothetical protein